jgi:hypothetical protein
MLIFWAWQSEEGKLATFDQSIVTLFSQGDRGQQSSYPEIDCARVPEIASGLCAVNIAIGRMDC